jgi:RimJ/RimL family protein N-acetyltransferase
MNIEVSLVPINEVKLDAVVMKQLKRLSQITTCERLKIFDDDLAVIAKYNKKIIGMCNIAMKSPEGHFPNEQEHEIPYLYNYMCDKAHYKKKASVAIMNFIKDLIKNGDYVKEINLDVLVENTHAQNFFKKNNFIENGTYQQSVREYITFTATV